MTNAPHRTLIAYFTKSSHGGFKAYDESGIARPFSNLLDFLNAAMVATRLIIVQEHRRVIIVALLIILQMDAWRLLNTETIGLVLL